MARAQQERQQTSADCAGGTSEEHTHAACYIRRQVDVEMI